MDVGASLVVMGGRFLGDYPVVLAGTSHGTCLCYGRLAGYQAAANAKGVQAWAIEKNIR